MGPWSSFPQRCQGYPQRFWVIKGGSFGEAYSASLLLMPSIWRKIIWDTKTTSPASVPNYWGSSLYFRRSRLRRPPLRWGHSGQLVGRIVWEDGKICETVLEEDHWTCQSVSRWGAHGSGRSRGGSWLPITYLCFFRGLGGTPYAFTPPHWTSHPEFAWSFAWRSTRWRHWPQRFVQTHPASQWRTRSILEKMEEWVSPGHTKCSLSWSW